jgi:hypothetical protein
MEALDFSQADLQANREGYLTERQQRLLGSVRRARGCGSRAAFIAILVSALSVGFAPLLFGGSESAGGEQTIRQVLPYTLAVAVVAVLIMLAALLFGYARSRDIRDGRMSIAEGHAHLTTRYLMRLRLTAYYVQIGGVRFQLGEDESAAFTEGEFYRVYYVKDPPAHVLLSAEVETSSW